VDSLQYALRTALTDSWQERSNNIMDPARNNPGMMNTRRLERAHIERRLRNSQPVGFFTIVATLLILQTVVLLMSGAISELASTRKLRIGRESSSIEQLLRD
jgi:hypothetical protein